MRKNEKKNNLYACNVYNVFGFSTLQTNAATITNASNLNMPKANYTGTFTENNNSARYYKFTVTTPGCMKVDLVAEFYQRILLLSSTGDELKSSDKDINDSGTSHQEIKYYLEPGTYYIGFGALRGIFITTNPYGYFSLNTSFTAVNVTEKESNDKMLFANKISIGQNIKGMFAVETDTDRYVDKDFYSIYLPKGLYTLSAQAEQDFNIGVYTSTGDEIYHTRISKSYSTGIASVNKDINLEAGSYYIMIEARNSGEYGLYNLSLKYSTFAPAKPSAPYVVSYGNTAVKLSWYKVTDAVGYTIYQKKGSTYKAIKNTTATTATIKGLKTGTAYAFRIRAYVVVNNKKNYSPYSDTCFTATKPAKNKITSITKISKKKSGSGYYLRAKIKWSKSSGANRYKVYYKVSGSSYKSLLGTYKGTSTTIQQYRSKYSTGKRKYTFYVVPVKYYNGKYYEGAMSSGKTVNAQ